MQGGFARLPLNKVFVATVVMVLVMPGAVMLIAGGMSQARYSLGYVIFAAGLLSIYRAALISLKGQPRWQIPILILYGIGLALWGRAQMDEPALRADYLSLPGTLIIMAGGLLHVRRIMQGKNLS